MAMSGATNEGDVMVDINTTPLIDVMLVLLTMLIITIPIQTHAVKLDLPQGASRADIQKAMDGHVLGGAVYIGLFTRQ